MSEEEKKEKKEIRAKGQDPWQSAQQSRELIPETQSSESSTKETTRSKYYIFSLMEHSNNSIPYKGPRDLSGNTYARYLIQ